MKKLIIAALILGAGVANATTYTYTAGWDAYVPDVKTKTWTVGGYTTPSACWSDGLTHGYLLDNGVRTTIDYPGACTNTYLTGINDSGEIIGWAELGYWDVGFVYANGGFTQLSAPFAPVDSWDHAVPLEINNAGQIKAVSSTICGDMPKFTATPVMVAVAPASVPLPASIWLFGSGLAWLFVRGTKS